MIRAIVAPQGPVGVFFQNPFVSVLPRLLIGPVAWLVWNALKKRPVPGLVLLGIAGSLTNTVLVLFALGLYKFLPWAALGSIAVVNGLPEAVAAALITLAVVSAWKRNGSRSDGSSLPDLPDTEDQ